MSFFITFVKKCDQIVPHCKNRLVDHIGVLQTPIIYLVHKRQKACTISTKKMLTFNLLTKYVRYDIFGRVWLTINLKVILDSKRMKES